MPIDPRLVAWDDATPAAAPVIDPRMVKWDSPSQENGPVSDFGSALLHNFMKPLHGAAQLVENGVAAGAKLLPDNPLSRAAISTAASDNAAIAKMEKDYQASVPNNAASYTGATLGAIAPFFMGGVSGALNAAGDAVGNFVARVAPKVLPKIASGVTQGGIVAATNPVDNGGDYWDEKARQLQTGAVIGGAIPAVSSAVGGVVGGLRNVAAPFANPQSVVRNGLQRWGVGPEGIDATQLIPGSLPTTAQAVGNPQIVAAEKALANNPQYKPLFDARNVANNEARWNAINGVAQSPQALDAAVQARASATGPLQQALLENGKPVSAQPILDQLDALSKSPLGQRPAIGSAATDIANQIRQNAAKDDAGNLTIGPAHLDVVRQNVKDFLAKYTPNGVVGTQQQAAFEPVRTAIVDAIDGANPGYRDYLAKYAKLSQPINTMQAGQSIVDNLGNRAPNASGAAQLGLGPVNAQVKAALAKQYGVSQEAEATLRSLQADLQRSGISNSVRSAGSDTAYNLQAPGWLGKQLYGSEFQGGKVMPLLGAALGFHTGGPMGTIGGFVGGKKLSDLASSRVNDALAEALLNPEVARSLLSGQPKQISPLLQGVLSRMPQASLLTGNSLVNQPPIPMGLLNSR